MRLLHCKECIDVLRLIDTWRSCYCGASAGQRLEDGCTYLVAGSAVVLGVAEDSLRRAEVRAQFLGTSAGIKAYVVEEDSPTIIKKNWRMPRKALTA